MTSVSRISGFNACYLWCAAKAHYTSDYDIVKYQWGIKLEEDTFRLRKDRFLFERLAREYEQEAIFKQALGFYLYLDPKAYPRGLIRPNLRVEKSLMRMRNLYEVFADDWKHYVAENGGNFLFPGVGFHDLLCRGDINPESAAIFYDYNELMRYHYEDHRIALANRIPKFSSFIGYDKGRIAAIVKSCA